MLFVRLICLVLALTALSPVNAETPSSWPNKTVRFVVPVVPGGGADVAARLVADSLTKRWKQPVVVENRPGADGIIAVRAVLAAKDGHTLLFSPSFPVAGIELIRKDLPYDPARDLQPISLVAEEYVAVVAPLSTNVKTFEELMAKVRAHPNELNYTSPPGVPYLVTAALQKRTGTQMKYVPYRSVGAALPDLLEGRIQLAFLPLSLAHSQVKAGKLRLLAVTSEHRTPFFPDTPSFADLGYADVATLGFVGLYAPTGIDVSTLNRIVADMHATLAEAQVKQHLLDAKLVPHNASPSELATAVTRQRARWADLVKKYSLSAVAPEHP